MDILEHDDLISWEALSTKYDLSASHKKTYNMIKNTCTPSNLPRNTKVDAHRYPTFLWKDGSTLPKIKAKSIYTLLNSDTSVIEHINTLWYVNHTPHTWQKTFEKLWRSPIPPKVK